MTTWMAREISATPDAVARLLRDGAPAVAAAADALSAAGPAWVSFVARGTSDHVATYGRYLVETTLGLPAMSAAPSVTTVYDAPVRWEGGALVAISQSGQSPDLVDVVTAAGRGGATTIAVTNDLGSPLAAAASRVVPCLAGRERAVAATKTYVTGLAAMAALVGAVSGSRSLLDGLAVLPGVLRRCLVVGDRWVATSGVVEAFARTDRAVLASRGYDLATVLETAIKLQETGGIHAGAYSTADLEHGPIALTRGRVPVLFVRPEGEMGRRVDGVLDRLRADGVRPWVIGGQEAPTTEGHSDGQRLLQLPVDVPSALAPAAFILPGQRLAEAVARARHRDPDRPVGLTKVTRTH